VLTSWTRAFKGNSMLRSRVFTIPIHRSYGDVYGFLSEPTNLPLWGGTEPESTMKHLGGSDYLVDLPSGRRVMRFTPRNEFGVLDYQVFLPGETEGPVTPARLHPNEEGCEFVLTWYQRPGVSDERFASESEWTYSDLLRMKAYIETR
jgi:hypothetical protein